MNAPHHLQLNLADVRDSDGETLLKVAQASVEELQRRAADSKCGDFMHIKNAAYVVEVSRETIRRWVRDDPSLGKHTPGGLVVSVSRLMARRSRS